ncbi:MAG: sugar ABC transporter substrate-binding protein [Solirubrobacteraceae bacterium]|jgi:D-xylose transport system substrate-binding protein
MRFGSSGRWISIAVGALASAVLVAAGCGGGQAGGGGAGKIALLLPESKTTRYEQQDRPNFERRVRELCPRCQVIYGNADQDPARQQQQAEAAITQGARVLVLDAVDVESAASIVQRAKRARVSVISYGRLVSNADLDYYISIDPFKVGQQQGRALVDALRRQGSARPSVVMINGAPTDSNAGPYKKGARSVLEAAGVKVIREYDTPDWSPDKAQQEMEQAITGAGKDGFDGVYVANDGMAGGAIAAMKAAQIDPARRPVTGQDAEAAAIQRILVGQQLMTVYQPIKRIAQTAADLAVPIANGRRPPDIARAKVSNGREDVPSVLLDTLVVTKANVKDTVIADRFLTPAQICRGEYAEPCRKAGVM